MITCGASKLYIFLAVEDAENDAKPLDRGSILGWLR